MDKKEEFLKMRIKLCNQNIIKFYKKYALDYLDDINCDELELKDAVKHLSKRCEKPEDSCFDFSLALFWYNVRKSYSSKLLEHLYGGIV